MRARRLGGAAAALLTTTIASGQLVQFDDVTTESFAAIPAGYGGFDWTAFNVIDEAAVPGSGYDAGTISPSYTAFNQAGGQASFASADGSRFDLEQTYLTAAWRDGLEVTMRGIRDGVQVVTITFDVDTDEPRLVVPSIFDVEEVVFRAVNGTNAGLGNDGTHFALDDLRWSPTKAPGDATGDDVVDVLDLLAVLAAWGACPDPCPPCAADRDGNCLVNVSDLLVVLADWGATRLGACCFEDGACTLVTGADCIDAGGSFQIGETCATFACPQPPANDDCDAATPVSEGSYPYDTTLATDSGPDLPESCEENGFDAIIVSDVWFLFTPTTSGMKTIDLCDTLYDTRLAVYANVCPPDGTLDLIACNDDDCGLRSRVVVPAEAGVPMLIRVGGFLNNSGPGFLNIMP